MLLSQIQEKCRAALRPNIDIDLIKIAYSPMHAKNF
jgi:hypothetical protein